MIDTSPELRPADVHVGASPVDAPDPDAPDGFSVLRFARPVPGFEERPREFALEGWGGEGSPFSLLRCVGDPELAFVVTHPAVFFPDYEPELDDATVDLLGLESADDALVLVVLTLGMRVEETTANLMGPIVAHRRTGVAVQAVLSAPGLDTKVPLVAS